MLVFTYINLLFYFHKRFEITGTEQLKHTTPLFNNSPDTCYECISEGIFIVGGSTSSGTNHTELIDITSSKPLCQEPPAFPSQKGRFGMIGMYLGNGSTLFCGGRDNKDAKVKKDCYRLVKL